jgi:hypothetical protein
VEVVAVVAVVVKAAVVAAVVAKAAHLRFDARPIDGEIKFQLL